MDDERFPVASPALAGLSEVTTPAQIMSLPMLSDLDPHGWREWFREAGIHGAPLPTTHGFSDSTDVMRAAVYGLGAALARKHIAAPYLQRYELVRLPGPAVRARFAYYVVHAAHHTLSPAGQLFLDWLKDQAKDERTPMPAIPDELLGRTQPSRA